MNVKSEESFGVIPLVEKDGKWAVLIILHKGGRHWGFPKGKSIAGEDPLISAGRELFEETGLTIENLLVMDPFIEKYSFYKRDTKVEKIVTFFPAKVGGELNLQPEEVIDAKWVPLSKAHTHLTHKESQNLVKELTRRLAP